MTPSLVSLPWLAEPPADFSARCRTCSDSAHPGSAIQNLASFRLSAQQSLTLARAIARCRKADLSLAPLSNFRLGILAGSTYDLLLDCVPAAAARHGVALEILTTPYDQVHQQALDPGSDVNARNLDAVLIGVDHRWFNLSRPDLEHAAEARTAAALDQLRIVVDALREHGNAPAILQTLPVPPHAIFGSYERRVSGSVRAMIEETNRGIVAMTHETGSYLLDVAALAERIGTDRWFDPVQWAAYKLPFSPECFPIYADTLGRLLGAIRGKARKCLVLDLDNTLWGGVIGDDGLERIVLGQGSARRGVIWRCNRRRSICGRAGSCSQSARKNNDAVARELRSASIRRCSFARTTSPCFRPTGRQGDQPGGDRQDAQYRARRARVSRRQPGRAHAGAGRPADGCCPGAPPGSGMVCLDAVRRRLLRQPPIIPLRTGCAPNPTERTRSAPK